MSARNRLVEKKKRRLIKSLRNTPPGYVDLVEYVRLRSRCSRGMAKRVILSGALTVDSHTVGFKTIDGRKVLDQCIPAKYRNDIVIRMPKNV